MEGRTEKYGSYLCQRSEFTQHIPLLYSTKFIIPLYICIIQGVDDSLYHDIGDVARAAIQRVPLDLPSPETALMHCESETHDSDIETLSQISDSEFLTDCEHDDDTDNHLDVLLKLNFHGTDNSDAKQSFQQLDISSRCRVLDILERASKMRRDAELLENEAIQILRSNNSLNSSVTNLPCLPPVKAKHYKLTIPHRIQINGKAKYQCTKCKRIFGSWCGTDAHIRKDHTGKEYGPCINCAKFTSYNRDSFRRHQNGCKKKQQKKPPK